MVGSSKLLNLLDHDTILHDHLAGQLLLLALVVPATPISPVGHSCSSEQSYPIMATFDRRFFS